MERIDARGRSCPQPVMMTKIHVEKGDEEIEVLLDNAVSASNVQRYLEKNGYSVRIIDEDGSIIIRAFLPSEGVAEVSGAPKSSVRTQASSADPAPEKAPPAPAEEAVSPPVASGALSSEPAASKGPEKYAVLISKKGIGGDDELLAEVLMKGFLGTLSQMTPPPSTLALMNEGVKLSVKNTSSLDHLLVLEKRGVRILVCGTCTNHFGITSDVGVGVVSNMFEITEALLEADKILSF